MRLPHTVLLLALLAGLALAATLMLRGGAGPALPMDGPDAAASPFDEPLEPATNGDERVDAPVADDDGAAEREDPGASDREAADVEPLADPGVGPLVIVVRGRPHQPAPGIEVAWIDRDVGIAQRARLPRGQADDVPDEDLPLRFGQKARTNERGELQLPPFDGVMLVAARDGDEFAAGVARPRRSRMVLVLQVDETLQLAVVDADGRGRAAVPVAVARTRQRNNNSEMLWHGETDARGRATVHHFQLRRPDPTKGETFVALAKVPLVDPAQASANFDGRPVPKEAVTIALPATRPLAVALLHRSGAPILAACDIRLRPVRQQPKELRLPPVFDQLRASKALGDVPLVFAHCGPALALQPSIAVDGARNDLRLPVLESPPATAPRDAPPLPLVLAEGCVVLAARVEDPTGAAFGGRAFDYALRVGAATIARGTLATLADGSGDLVAVPPPANGALALVLRHTAEDGTVLGATVDLATIADGERRDLGTVRLQPEPLIARGIVRDDLGAPIGGASIQVERQRSDRREQWVGESMLAVRSADDGTFAIHGALPRGPFRVRAEAENHFAAVTDLLSPGATLDLRLSRVGICKGRLLLPDWLPQNAAVVALQPLAAAGERPGRAQSAPVRHRRGYFWLGGLQPGLYTLTVTVRNVREPLATFEGLRIEPGENEDPRLSPLDLSTALYRYRLRAIGPGGRELADLDGPILWRIARPDGEQTVTGFRWQKGKAELITPVPYLEVTTLGRGIAPTTVQLAAGDHDVYLEKLLPFVVVLPGVRGACGPTRAIRVSTIFTGDTGLPQGLSGQDQQSGESFSFARWDLGKSGGGWLDPFDRAEIELSRGGPHEVVLRIYEGDKQTGRQASIALGTVDVVVDGSQRQPTVLTVDPQQLEAALRELVPAADASAPRRR